jgi:ABC-type transport system involved in multi-copper enzyme maturation permease subunit
MTGLTLNEFRRLMSRRITWFFPAGVVALMSAGVAIAYFVISNDDDNSPNFVDDIAGGVELESLFAPVAFVLPLMAFVIGASYFGADVKTGVIEQILTWEPRRARLLIARVISSVVGVALLTAVVAMLYVVLMFVLAALTGTTDGITGEVWSNLLQAILRFGLAGGLFSAFGLGVTVITNNSLASIVGFVIYFFIIDQIIGVFLRRVSPYTPVTNTSAFASGTDVERIEGSAFGEQVETVAVHGYIAAGAIVVAYVIGTLVIGAMLFQRRDIE